MRTMRMEREDIENSLKVLSHIVDDDFIITVDEARKIIRIDGETIEVLQAQVKRLEEANDELREAQTYIDRYGDEWMTSAKDVPTAAYEHGYFDGMDEAKAQLPKRGEWIIVDEWKNMLGDKLMKIKCPFCNHQIKLYERPMPKYCDSCGAKMEVQDADK